MLTVWTGLPGSGKTSGVVERVLLPLAAKGWIEHAIDPEGNKVEVKRRLFTNIKGLLLEHEPIDAEQLMKWHEWVQPGDLIVFDEVQKPWPLVGANVTQPKCITELETHRHYGIDMHLLTQHPMLINPAIVRLAGQHLHIRKLGNSRYATIYEWDGVSRTLLYKNAFAKKAWRRSKKTEKSYRSSSLHTKQKRAVPTVLLVLLVVAVLLPLGIWRFQGKFQERYFGEKQHAELAKADAAGAAKAGGAASGSVASAVASQPAFIDDRVAWIPRVSTRPESAPAYDAVRQVVAMPVVVGGVCKADGCICVTQQGTNAGLSDDECRAWLKNPVFDAYKQPNVQQATPASTKPEEAPTARSGPALVVMDGPGWRDPAGLRTGASAQR